MTERSTIMEDQLKSPSRTTAPLQTRSHPCTRDFLCLENGASYELWKSRSIMPVKASGDKHFSYGKSSENFATLLIMRMVLIEEVSKIVRMDQGIGWLLALRSFLQQCP